MSSLAWDYVKGAASDAYAAACIEAVQAKEVAVNTYQTTLAQVEALMALRKTTLTSKDSEETEKVASMSETSELSATKVIAESELQISTQSSEP